MVMVKKKPDYKWVIALSCFLLGFFGLGFCSGNKGLYLSAITEALQIPRSLFSLNDTVRYVTNTIVNIFFATLLHKLGVRKMVAAGVLCLIAQCLLAAVATDVWGFYLSGVFLGCGMALCTTTMISFIIRRWHKENTGKVLGFVLAANGAGAAAATQLVSPIIYQEGNPFGYRNAYLLMAAILVVMGLVVVPLLREKPACSETAEAQVKKSSKSRDWPGEDWEHVRKKPIFYLAAVCIFLTGMCLQGLVGINAAHMRDSGLEADYVAMVVSIASLALAAMKFLAGFSYDRFGMRVTMTACDLSAVFATLLLSLVGVSALGRISAVGYAVISAAALPLETIMVSLFASELFGNRAFPHTMSIFSAVNTAGFALSAPLANWCFDSFGSYVPVIIAYCAIMTVVMIAFQFILTVAHRDRKKMFAES